MGIFGDEKPKITGREEKDFRVKARMGGMSDTKLNEVENVMHGHLDEPGSERGIDAKELDRGMQHLKEHQRENKLSDKDLEKIEGGLREGLRKRL